MHMNIMKRIFKGRKKFIVIGILIILLGLTGWRIFAGKDKNPQFQTTPVGKGMIISSVSASGQFLSVNVMSATTKASGIIKKVYVKDSDQVKKGDKILEIDLDLQGKQKNASAWVSYLSAKNSLASAQAALYSSDAQMWAAHQTFMNDAVSRSLAPEDPTYIQQNDNWLAAEAKYKNQQQAIAQFKANVNNNWLNYIQTSPIITAPTNGVVTSLVFAEGMSIGTLDTGNTTSNQKVVTIKTEGMPIVSVNLSEIDVSRVETGKKATLILDSIPEKTFTGKVVGIDRIGQTNSGVTQYPAIIQLDSSADQILPNMAATANIILERKDNVLLVPSSVVQNRDGQGYVETLVDGQSQSVPVETGLFSDTQTEIISGLKEGDLVIKGTTSLIDSSSRSPSSGGSPFGGGVGGMIKMAH